MERCVMQLNGCTQAESWTGYSAIAVSGRTTCPTYGKRWRKSCLRQRARYPISERSRCQSYRGSTEARKAAGGADTGVGLPPVTDYRTLTEKYIRTTDLGIWEVDMRLPKIYKALAHLTPSELTIFLLVVELGTIAEVARRLKCHRSTVHRIYHRIEKRLHNDLGRLEDIG